MGLLIYRLIIELGIVQAAVLELGLNAIQGIFPSLFTITIMVTALAVEELFRLLAHIADKLRLNHAIALIESSINGPILGFPLNV